MNVSNVFFSTKNNQLFSINHRLTLSLSNMVASSAKRRLPLLTPSFLASLLRFTWRGTGEDYGKEGQVGSGTGPELLTWWSWRAHTSHRLLFFLSFRKRFLVTAPLTSCRWGIISSTVNTWGRSQGHVSYQNVKSRKFKCPTISQQKQKQTIKYVLTVPTCTVYLEK